MTNEQLAVLSKDIAEWEGVVSHLYLDTRGLPTIGVGFLMKTPEEFAKLPLRFKNDGLRIGPRDATPAEMRAEYARVLAIGQATGEAPRRGASSYRAHADLVYLTREAIDHKMREMLVDAYIPGVVKLLPDFETYPQGPQRAVVDIAWNCGVSGFGKFGNLIACCKDRDWKGAAPESHVRSSREARNKWREEMFLSAVDGATA